MTEAEANTIVDMIQNEWMGGRDLSAKVRAHWVHVMARDEWDAEIATRAVARLARETPDRMPTLPALRETVEMLTPKKASQVCRTCGGDRFVLYALQEPPYGEEYAPCPTCNSTADPTFRRYDGTMTETPDPAKIRERLEEIAASLGMPSQEEYAKREIPEWVYVWAWARGKGAVRPFPQQAGQNLDGEPLTENEYEKLRELWVEAGSPRTKNPLAAAVGGR